MEFISDYHQKALVRFAQKCRFCAFTGCVEWIGGTSSGKGNFAPYGVFWYEDRRWFSHRWSAKFIYGREIEDLHVDHECRNTLCVHHVSPKLPSVNMRLRWERQDRILIPERAVPFYAPPEWLRPFIQPAPLEPPF